MRTYIGLISGTSADGIDAALVEFAPQPRLRLALRQDYPEPLRQALLALATEQAPISLRQLGSLDHGVAVCAVEAVQRLLQQADTPPAAVTAIGSHGQTIAHYPDHEPPFSLQVGDPSVIAEYTGITTVADFRRRDMAAGGQGAPLVPIFHQSILSSTKEDRVVANIGGMANITLLPRAGAPVRGFDTGPGNALLDEWISARRGEAFDRDGAWAATGTVERDLLRALLADPYFERRPPKSTGREYFNRRWLEGRLPTRELRDGNVQATLSQLSAETIAAAVRAELPGAARLIVCGGGARNHDLLGRLGTALAPMPVVTSDIYGVDPDWVEAMAFAWLAARTLEGLPGNLPEVTGARRPVILGGIYPGRG